MTTQEALRKQGEGIRARLFGAADSGTRSTTSALGFDDFLLETEFGIVWCRPGMALTERMIATLAALGCVQRPAALRRYVGAALNIGLDARAISEVFIQIGIYAGFTASEEALGIAAEVFAARGAAIAPKETRNDTLDELSRRGGELLKTLHRDAGDKGYASPDNTVTGALYPVAIQYGYGEIWFRPGLTQRQRVLCSVAAFTALRLEGQTRKFGQAALNLGATRTEVIETVIQTAPFSGFAPALNALAVLSEVLRPD